MLYRVSQRHSRLGAPLQPAFLFCHGLHRQKTSMPRWTFVLLWAAQSPRDERRPSGLKIAWRLISPPFFFDMAFGCSLWISHRARLSRLPGGPLGHSTDMVIRTSAAPPLPSSMGGWVHFCCLCNHRFQHLQFSRLLLCPPILFFRPYLRASSLSSRFALSLLSAPGWIRGGGYSRKDLGALYNQGKGHLGEKVQQASVLKPVVSWLKKANTMVINIMCRYRYLGLGDIIWD